MGPLGCRAGFSTRRGPYCCKSGGLTQVPTRDTLASRGVSAGPAAQGREQCSSLGTQDLQTPRRGQVPLMGLKGLLHMTCGRACYVVCH